MIRIRCTTHGHYLKHVSITGTTWRNSVNEAKVYTDRAKAHEDSGCVIIVLLRLPS